LVYESIVIGYIIANMDRKDTSLEAIKVLIDRYRMMPTTVKGEMIFDARRTGKMLSMAGIKLLYPNVSETEVWHLWAKRHLGEQLYNKVYGSLSDE
jgi:hypothetical protein